VGALNKKDLFTEINDVEEQVGNLHLHLGEFKKKIILLLEENKRLSIENQQLRKLLKKEIPLAQDDRDLKTQAIGEGYENLARLYHEGFHICNVYYGHFRTEGDCLFCLSFFNK
jgi:regulator of replication initiation timing